MRVSVAGKDFRCVRFCVAMNIPFKYLYGYPCIETAQLIYFFNVIECWVVGEALSKGRSASLALLDYIQVLPTLPCFKPLRIIGVGVTFCVESLLVWFYTTVN